MTFAGVGGAATVTHYLSALAANTLAGATPLEANVSGYLCAVMVSYFGHALFTFRRPVLLARQFTRFLTISLAGLVIGQAITFATSELLHLPFAVALVPVVTMVPVFTYVASSLWAFARGPVDDDGEPQRSEPA